MKYRYRTDEEMKDSGIDWIGKMPQKWRSTKVKHLFKLINEKSQEEKPIILSLTQGGIKIRDISKNDGQLAASYQGYTKVKKNYFVLNPMDLVSGYVDKSEFEGVISPAYTTFCKRENIILDEEFYKQYFQMHYHHKFLFPFGEGVSFEHRWTLKNETFLNIPIIEPDLVEQIKISKFLIQKNRDFNSIISKKLSLIEKLEEAKKSLISEVVTGKVKVVKTEEGYDIVPRKPEEMKDSGVEWLGLLPKKWDVKRLRFLGTLQNGISKSSEEFGYGFPFVSYGDVYRNMSLPQFVNGLVNSSANDRKIYSVEQGDVFFTRTSETIDEIGISSVCLESIPEATFAGFLIRFRPNSKLLFKGFSKYYFRCILNRNYFVKEMNLVTRASLSQNLLNNLSVVLPTYEDQENIYWGLEYKIGTIDNIIEKIKSEIQKLKEAKQSLIAEAVTGKIEILD